MLELLEKVDLPEGKEVSVTILETPGARSSEGLTRSAGTWKGLVDAEKLIENIYADRLISLHSSCPPAMMIAYLVDSDDDDMRSSRWELSHGKWLNTHGSSAG